MGAARIALTGEVVVVDGDTLRVDGKRIRLRGVDAPEIGQPCVLEKCVLDCGALSRRALVEIIVDADVLCEGFTRIATAGRSRGDGSPRAISAHFSSGRAGLMISSATATAVTPSIRRRRDDMGSAFGRPNSSSPGNGAVEGRPREALVSIGDRQPKSMKQRCATKTSPVEGRSSER